MEAKGTGRGLETSMLKPHGLWAACAMGPDRGACHQGGRRGSPREAWQAQVQREAPAVRSGPPRSPTAVLTHEHLLYAWCRPGHVSAVLSQYAGGAHCLWSVTI